MAPVIAILLKGWAWLLPFVGPWLLRLSPWLVWLPGVASIGKSLRVISYVAVLGIGAWGASKAIRWLDGDKLTPREAQIACNTTIQSSYAAAQLHAARAQKVLLAARSARIAADEAELDRRKREMDDAAVAPTDSEPVLAADDPWLRSWAKRR